ncbi:MAG: competence protein [Flavobacteriales bacterium]|nr:MAG: competence protein [Flavobacteriales bacterium]
MKINQYLPFQLIFFLITGIVIGKYVVMPITTVVILIGIATILSLISYMVFRKRYFNQQFFTISTWCCFLIIGISVYSFHQQQLRPDFYENFKVSENEVILKINEVLKPTDYAYNYFAEVISCNGKKTTGKLLVNQPKDSASVPFKIDHEIIAHLTFQKIKKPQNPYQFDYKKFLENKQVYHSVKLNRYNHKVLSRKVTSVRGFAYEIRHQIGTRLEMYPFKKDELAVIKALLLGQRDEISQDLSNNYRNAGAIHILAISGLHIGIILLFIKFMLKPLESITYGKKLSLVITIFVMWGFAFLAGLSASVVRAVTMFTAVAIAVFGQRGFNTYQALTVSLFVLLLYRPQYLFEVGFQLSYLAVFFIVWLQPMLEKLIYIKWKPLRYFWQLFTVSVAAQIGVLPLTLYYFHQFPGLFFIANLIIIPIMGFILISGIFLIIMAMLEILPDFLALAYQKLIESMNFIISSIADKDSFIIKNIFFTFVAMVLLYSIILSIARWFKEKEIKYLYLGLAFIIGFQLHFLYLKVQSLKINRITVFNEYSGTLITHQQGKKLCVLYNSTSVESDKNTNINNYITGTNTKLANESDSNFPIFTFNDKTLYIIDSSAIYQLSCFNPEILLLSSSPKVNLERVIHRLKPKQILADGSNYPGYISQWKKTCKNMGVPFSYTAEDGAFQLNNLYVETHTNLPIFAFLKHKM